MFYLFRSLVLILPFERLLSRHKTQTEALLRVHGHDGDDLLTLLTSFNISHGTT